MPLLSKVLFLAYIILVYYVMRRIMSLARPSCLSVTCRLLPGEKKGAEMSELV